MAVGIFADGSYGAGWKAYAFGFTYVMFSLVNAVKSMRVSKEAELEGLDIPEFGMEAYPEGEQQISLA